MNIPKKKVDAHRNLIVGDLVYIEKKDGNIINMYKGGSLEDIYKKKYLKYKNKYIQLKLNFQ